MNCSHFGMVEGGKWTYCPTCGYQPFKACDPYTGAAATDIGQARTVDITIRAVTKQAPDTWTNDFADHLERTCGRGKPQ
jgi:hypothetical protein